MNTLEQEVINQQNRRQSIEIFKQQVQNNPKYKLKDMKQYAKDNNIQIPRTVRSKEDVRAYKLSYELPLSQSEINYYAKKNGESTSVKKENKVEVIKNAEKYKTPIINKLKKIYDTNKNPKLVDQEHFEEGEKKLLIQISNKNYMFDNSFIVRIMPEILYTDRGDNEVVQKYDTEKKGEDTH